VPEYLTIDDVCELLQLGKRTVYELARTGRLPGAAKVGGQWRVNKAKLTAWLEAGGEFSLESGSEPSE
jgi:excisionase family DNA binding protein